MINKRKDDQHNGIGLNWCL